MVLTSAFIHTRFAFTKYESYIPTLRCDADGYVGPPPHHLRDCPLKYPMVGSFNISGAMFCGELGKKLVKRKVEDGTRVSFLGNATGHRLVPWATPKGLKVCLFEQGSVASTVMVKTARQEKSWGFLWTIIIMMYLTMESMRCVILNNEEHFAWIVIVPLIVLALVFLTAMHVNLGLGGFVFGCILLVLGPAACWYYMNQRGERVAAEPSGGAEQQNASGVQRTADLEEGAEQRAWWQDLAVTYTGEERRIVGRTVGPGVHGRVQWVDGSQVRVRVPGMGPVESPANQWRPVDPVEGHQWPPRNAVPRTPAAAAPARQQAPEAATAGELAGEPATEPEPAGGPAREPEQLEEPTETTPLLVAAEPAADDRADSAAAGAFAGEQTTDAEAARIAAAEEDDKDDDLVWLGLQVGLLSGLVVGIVLTVGLAAWMAAGGGAGKRVA